MTSLNWLSAVISFALESSIEVIIVILVIKAVIRMKGLDNPVTTSRFLLLPLIIPVIFSPAFHLMFPRLGQTAIIAQIEKAFAFLEVIRSYESYIAPFLILAFLLLLAYNLLTGFAISLREIRSNNQSRIPAHWEGQKILNRLAESFSVSCPLLTISARHPKAAYVLGWNRPIITLGNEWLRVLDMEEFEAVLAHELAHFKHSDNWQLLIAKTCRDLMFFNPLVHYIYNQYHEACEQAADDLALHITQKPLALASSLLKFWRMQQAIVIPAGSIGFVYHPQQLERRIQRLCNYSQETETTSPDNRLFYSLSITLTVVLSII